MMKGLGRVAGIQAFTVIMFSVLFSFCLPQRDALCAGSAEQTAEPPVNTSGLLVPEHVEGDWPFARGLDPGLLPEELEGMPLEPGSAYGRTGIYGMRMVLGLYGESVVAFWKAPVTADLEHGLIMDRGAGYRNEAMAVRWLQSIRDGRSYEPGAYYRPEIVTASGDGKDGLAWFTTCGESTLLWQTPRGHRCSFWWRSGVWFFGVDAPATGLRDRIARDLLAYLQNLQPE